MEYAVFKTGGKQYKASKGDTLEIDKVPGEENKSFAFEEVLLYVSGGEMKIGKPNLTGFKVVTKIIKQKKGKKIDVEKFKAKSRYRRSMGFRPMITEILVEEIFTGEKKAGNLKKPVKPKKS